MPIPAVGGQIIGNFPQVSRALSPPHGTLSAVPLLQSVFTNLQPAGRCGRPGGVHLSVPLSCQPVDVTRQPREDRRRHPPSPLADIGRLSSADLIWRLPSALPRPSVPDHRQHARALRGPPGGSEQHDAAARDPAGLCLGRARGGGSLAGAAWRRVVARDHGGNGADPDILGGAGEGACGPGGNTSGSRRRARGGGAGWAEWRRRGRSGRGRRRDGRPCERSAADCCCECRCGSAPFALATWRTGCTPHTLLPCTPRLIFCPHLYRLGPCYMRTSLLLPCRKCPVTPFSHAFAREGRPTLPWMPTEASAL